MYRYTRGNQPQYQDRDGSGRQCREIWAGQIPAGMAGRRGNAAVCRGVPAIQKTAENNGIVLLLIYVRILVHPCGKKQAQKGTCLIRYPYT